MRSKCAKEILIITEDFDQSLCNYVGTGGKWGLNIEFSADSSTREISDILARHSAYAETSLLVINGFFFPLYDKRKIGNSAPSTPRIFIYSHDSNNIETGNFPEYESLEIDSLETYFRLNISLLKGKTAQLEMKGYSSESGVFLGMNDIIMRGAELKAPIILGDNVQIECDVKTDGGVIVGDTCIIDRGSRLKDTILFPETYVGTDLNLESKIVFKNSIIDPVKGLMVSFSDASFASEVKLSGANIALRRFGELILSSVLIVILSPIFALMSLFGRPESRRIALPSAKGSGKIFKYRKYKRDKKISNIWFFKLSLDRLSMLLSVIAGNAKLIGDTPHDFTKNPEILKQYDTYTPGAFSYSDSLGHTDVSESILDDLFYKHHKTLKNDLQILLCSIVRRLFGWEAKI